MNLAFHPSTECDKIPIVLLSNINSEIEKAVQIFSPISNTEKAGPNSSVVSKPIDRYKLIKVGNRQLLRV